MKFKNLKIIFLILILCIKIKGTAQNEYLKTDEWVLNIKDEFEDVESLSNYFISKTNNDLQLVRAFHIWVINNIEYDLDKSFQVNNTEYKRALTSETIKSKKGIYLEAIQVFVVLLSFKSYLNYSRFLAFL